MRFMIFIYRKYFFDIFKNISLKDFRLYCFTYIKISGTTLNINVGISIYFLNTKFTKDFGITKIAANHIT